MSLKVREYAHWTRCWCSRIETWTIQNDQAAMHARKKKFLGLFWVPFRAPYTATHFRFAEW